ncbi:hypothetical protein GCM10009839_11830 [Catenulispora yoronensis]|uniref:Uncharacterized protein n=1 Tax=Catenulispora yoronensis TaxID=450799 RepID=A0ABP5F604_9ACTN
MSTAGMTASIPNAQSTENTQSAENAKNTKNTKNAENVRNTENTVYATPIADSDTSSEMSAAPTLTDDRVDATAPALAGTSREPVSPDPATPDPATPDPATTPDHRLRWPEAVAITLALLLGGAVASGAFRPMLPWLG